MKRFPSAPSLFIYGSIFSLIVLGCRTADLIAQGGGTPTRAATRATVRPTFTTVPPTVPPTNTALPAKAPTRASAPRVPPSRTPIPSATIPPPPTTTPDPYAGFIFRPSNIACGIAPNTRIQGTVYADGAKSNNVWVRVTSSEDGPPSIDDALTGTDPTDSKHVDPALQGQYRLGLYEGRQGSGTWFVFVLGLDKEAISPKVRVVTSDGPGCNTATVDFVHR